MSISIPGARLISAEEARAVIEPVLKPYLNAKDLQYALDVAAPRLHAILISAKRG